MRIALCGLGCNFKSSVCKILDKDFGFDISKESVRDVVEHINYLEMDTSINDFQNMFLVDCLSKLSTSPKDSVVFDRSVYDYVIYNNILSRLGFACGISKDELLKRTNKLKELLKEKLGDYDLVVFVESSKNKKFIEKYCLNDKCRSAVFKTPDDYITSSVMYKNYFMSVVKPLYDDERFITMNPFPGTECSDDIEELIEKSLNEFLEIFDKIKRDNK